MTTENEHAMGTLPDGLLPALRMFMVRRETVLNREYAIEEILVMAHAISVSESGALSFITFSIWNGSALPQTTRLFSRWEDCEELPLVKAGTVAH